MNNVLNSVEHISRSVINYHVGGKCYSRDEIPIFQVPYELNWQPATTKMIEADCGVHLQNETSLLKALKRSIMTEMIKW